MKRAWWIGIVLAGCGGNSAQQQSPLAAAQSAKVPSSKSAADADIRLESKIVTEKAVTVTFDVLKATVAIPDGAVTGTEKLTGQIPVEIKALDGIVPHTLVTFSGPTFGKPVKLTLPKPKKKGDLVLVEWQDNQWMPTDAVLDKKKNVFTLTTAHLGTYAVFVKPKTKKPATKAPDQAAKEPEKSQKGDPQPAQK